MLVYFLSKIIKSINVLLIKTISFLCPSLSLTHLLPEADPIRLAGEKLTVGKVEALNVARYPSMVLEAVCWGSPWVSACYLGDKDVPLSLCGGSNQGECQLQGVSTCPSIKIH